MTSFRRAAFPLLVLSIAGVAAAQDRQALPKVRVVATGGTIAGEQRPPTGISPDGPINLLSAIRVAASPVSRGKGVTAVMDDWIISARDVTKIYPRTGGFEAAEMGMLGVVTSQAVEFFYQPV